MPGSAESRRAPSRRQSRRVASPPCPAARSIPRLPTRSGSATHKPKAPPVDRRTQTQAPPVDRRGQPEEDGEVFGASQCQKARAVREHYQARLAKLEYEQRIKKLVPTDEVKVAAFNLLRRCTNGPARTGDRMWWWSRGTRAPWHWLAIPRPWTSDPWAPGCGGASGCGLSTAAWPRRNCTAGCTWSGRPRRAAIRIRPAIATFPSTGRSTSSSSPQSSLVARTVKGYRRPEWKQTSERNEALDCRVYARAAAAVIGIDRFDEARWVELENALKRPSDAVPAPAQPPRASYWDQFSTPRPSR